MKHIITRIAAMLAVAGLTGTASAVTVNFTVAEGYATGSSTVDSPDWSGRTDWNNVVDGAMGISAGAFLRVTFEGESALNNELDSFSVGMTFALQGDFAGTGFVTPEAQDWREPTLILDVTEQLVLSPPGRMGATLALDDEVTPTEMEFYLTAAAGTGTNNVAKLGPATNYNGHTFTLDLEYTRLDATNYSVVGTLDSLDDAAGPFVVTNALVTPDPAFSASQTVRGFINAVNGVTNGYTGVQVSEFRFDSIEPDIIASTPVAAGRKAVLNAYQFKTENETILQVTSDLTDTNSWVDVPGATAAAGESLVSYIDESSVGADAALYRVIEILPPPPLFSDDFEGPDQGWTTATNGVGNTFWELGTPNLNLTFAMLDFANSGVNCWGTDLDGGYDNGTDIVLLSPEITLPESGNIFVEWSEWRDIDDDPAAVDFAYVELVDLDAVTTYTLRPPVSDSDQTWTARDAAVPAAALGNRVQIQFRFTSDAIDTSTGWGGWYIDDVGLRADP